MRFLKRVRGTEKLISSRAQKFRFRRFGRGCSLWASNRNPAPPGGFLETTMFGNLSHRAIEIRLPAKIPVLDKAVRALFFQNGRQISTNVLFLVLFFLYFDNFHSV